MTPEQLKASILQAAIQGKLVDQNMEDISIERLCAELKDEKQKRVDAGSIKKEKILPEIDEDNKPFDIPETWRWLYCRDVMRFINGRAYKKPELLSKGKYPILRVGNFFTNDSLYYSDLELDEDKYCDNGDLLYAWSASFGPKIWDGEKVIFHYHIWKLDVFHPMDINYLYYYLLADTIRIKNSSHGLGFVFVTKEFMESRPIPVPPLEEQHRIVAKIEELLPYVDRYAEAYEKLEQFNAKFPEDMKKSILQYVIQGKLVEQRPEEGTAEELYQQIQDEKQKLIKEGKIKKEKPLAEITEDEIPFDIPESWKWCYLQDIAVLNSGNQYEELSSGVPYIKVADMNLEENKEEITTSTRYTSQENKGVISVNSIIFPKRGGAIATNKKRLVKKSEIYIDSNTMAMTLLHEGLLPYIKFWFDGVDLGKLQSGSSVPQINNKDIYPLLVPLPPLEEQHRIVAKIEELLPYCDQLIR